MALEAEARAGETEAARAQAQFAIARAEAEVSLDGVEAPTEEERERVARIESKPIARPGEAIGLTFQQVQKYERGANRIGASRLHELSVVLDVPVSFFFDDVDPVRAPAIPPGFAEPQEAFDSDPLRPLADRGVNLTRIESRPSRRRAWDYFFFLDLDGHLSDERVAEAIEALKGSCEQVKVLGSYPRAEAPE